MIIDPKITEKFVTEELKGRKIKKDKNIKMEVTEPKIYKVSFCNIELKPIVNKETELYITSEEKDKRLKDLIHLDIHDAAILWKHRDDLPLSWRQKKDREPRRYICIGGTDVEHKKGKVKKSEKILFYYTMNKWWIDFLEEGSTIHSSIVWATYVKKPETCFVQIQEAISALA